MGTGDTVISGTFRPETKSPDFDLAIKIDRTQMRTMKNVLRAYGNFDVTADEFSLYSELRVKNGRVDGYIKPLFKDMKVYDARQDNERSVFCKLYEGLVGMSRSYLEMHHWRKSPHGRKYQAPWKTLRSARGRR